MIKINKDIFSLNTKSTSYIMALNKDKLVNLYYANTLNSDKLDHLRNFNTQKLYNSNSLDKFEFNCQEEEALVLENYQVDFRYLSHNIIENIPSINTPFAKVIAKDDNIQTLIINLVDKTLRLNLSLIYSVFENSDVICKSIILKNQSNNTYIIKKVASSQLSLYSNDFKLKTFTSNFDNSFKSDIHPLLSSTISTSSKNAFLYSNKDFYSINTLYAGSNIISAKANEYGISTISSYQNEMLISLISNQSYQSPITIHSYADNEGELLNRVKNFSLNHIYSSKWKRRVRPLGFHSFNSLLYNYDEKAAQKIVKKASDTGFELFILDDGWFSLRDNDSTSYADYYADTKKFSSGLKAFSDLVHKQGMLFGLYLAPQVISKHSNLFIENPDFALITNEEEPYFLDLSQNKVVNYLTKTINELIKINNIDYIYWHLPKEQKYNKNNYDKDYTLGYYTLLKNIRGENPDLLLSTNSINFDLGLLNFFDFFKFSNTQDSFYNIESYKAATDLLHTCFIENTIYDRKNPSSLRKIDIQDQFNLNCFSTLSYQFDYNNISQEELRIVARELELFKIDRAIFQYGDLIKINPTTFQIMNKDRSKGFLVYFVEKSKIQSNVIKLNLDNLNPDNLYLITNLRQKYELKLLNPIVKNLGVKLYDIFYDQLDSYSVEEHTLVSTGLVFKNTGLILSNNYQGLNFNKDSRIMLDYSTRFFEIRTDKKD